MYCHRHLERVRDGGRGEACDGRLVQGGSRQGLGRDDQVLVQKRTGETNYLITGVIKERMLFAGSLPRFHGRVPHGAGGQVCQQRRVGHRGRLDQRLDPDRGLRVCQRREEHAGSHGEDLEGFGLRICNNLYNNTIWTLLLVPELGMLIKTT